MTSGFSEEWNRRGEPENSAALSEDWCLREFSKESIGVEDVEFMPPDSLGGFGTHPDSVQDAVQRLQPMDMESGHASASKWQKAKACAAAAYEAELVKTDSCRSLGEASGEQLQHHMQLRKEIGTLKALLLSSIVVVFTLLFLGITVAFSFVVFDEGVKIDSQTGVVLSSAGIPIKVGRPQSYAMLFELPYYSIETLSQVEHITLQLRDGVETSVSVGRVIKEAPGLPIATFYPLMGGEIVIDAGCMTAVAVLGNERHFFDGSAFVRRRLGVGLGALQLRGDADFFMAANGFEGRRMTAGSDAAGWAALGMAASEAVVDQHIDERQQGQGGGGNDTHWGSANVLVQGDLSMQTGEDAGLVISMVFYYSTPSNLSKARVFLPDGGSRLADFGVGMAFSFDASGHLLACDAMVEDDDDPLSFAQQQQAAGNLTTMVLANCGRMARGVDPSGDRFLFHARSVEANVDADARTVVATPKASACSALHARAFAEGLGHNGSRRLAASGGSASALELWKQSVVWEGEGALPPGTTTLHSCTTFDGKASIRRSIGNEVLLVFQSSNTFLDLFQTLLSIPQKYGDKWYHGFYLDYVLDLKACVDQGVAAHGPLDYIIGWSLGGAAATIYSKLTGHPATNGVVSFGAPKTSYDDTCSVPGVRYQHAEDPAGSHVLGTHWALKHDVAESVRLYDHHVCTKRRWYCFTCCSWKTTRRTQSQNCGAVSTDGGWPGRFAYLFWTNHDIYNLYLGR